MESSGKKFPERLEMYQPAPWGVRFAKDSFADQIGKSIPVKDQSGETIGFMRLSAVEVVEDGTAARFITWWTPKASDEVSEEPE